MAEDKSRLEVLPPEILTLIMTCISSPQSLYALIRTSRYLYHVFSFAKQRILSAVICEMLHPQVFHDAWALALLSPCKTPFATRGDSFAYIESYENGGKTPQVPRLISLSMSVAICQLHQCIEYFCRDFMDWCAKYSARYDFSLGSGGRSLSWTEEGRVLRAFYRLQLCTRLLCYNSDKDDWRSLVDNNLPRHFFRIFPLYQIEEFCCLHYYLRLRLKEVYKRTEDRFVESVLAETLEIHQSSDNGNEERNSNEENEDGDNGTNDESPAWCRSFDRWDPNEPDTDAFFSSQLKRAHFLFVDYQISNGLPLLRQFLEAGINEQTNLVKKLGPLLADPNVCGLEMSRRSDRSFFFFRYPPYMIVRAAVNLEETVPFKKDDFNRPNEAYLGVAIGNPDGLRECGYAFWDSVRLRSSGMIAGYGPA